MISFGGLCENNIFDRSKVLNVNFSRLRLVKNDFITSRQILMLIARIHHFPRLFVHSLKQLKISNCIHYEINGALMIYPSGVRSGRIQHC